MIDNFVAFSATEVGYNHIKVDKVCEDASGYYSDDSVCICVIADGHGSDNYPRTDRGAKIAVDSAITCVRDFVKVANATDVLCDSDNDYAVLLQLAKSILMKWHEAVNSDYELDPFTEEDLKGVSEKYKEKYTSEDVRVKKIEKAYGCTLIMYVVTEAYSFGMQIGDGKCVLVNREGTFSEPIPWDENCQLNVTTSICDDDAIQEFRFFVSNEKPAAVFCGSDGIDDSYTNEEELHALYRSILKIFIEHGNEVGKKEIEEYLPTLTKKGSGDDVSIALLIDENRIGKMIDVFNVQTELFDLNVERNGKKHQVDVMSEQKNGFVSRLRQWVDSGSKPNESAEVDVRQVNDLGISIEQIEKEIAKVEEKIREKKATLISIVKSIDNMEKEVNNKDVMDCKEMSSLEETYSETSSCANQEGSAVSDNLGKKEDTCDSNEEFKEDNTEEA